MTNISVSSLMIRRASSSVCTTLTPSRLKSRFLVNTTFCLFGKGLPMDSNVRLPMTVVWPDVSALKCLRSLGRCQGSAPPIPMTPLSATATTKAMVTCQERVVRSRDHHSAPANRRKYAFTIALFEAMRPVAKTVRLTAVRVIFTFRLGSSTVSSC